MKTLMNTKKLPYITLLLGLLGAALRRLLYSVAVDEKGLIVSCHPLELGLWLVTAAVVLVVLTVRKLDGSARFEDNFHASIPAAVGCIAGAVGIGLTVLLQEPGIGGGLGNAWKITGVLAFASLDVIAKYRWEGKQPFFGLHALVCVFFAIHMVTCYRGWSGDPQLQDYVFPLFGCMGLMLFAYYQAAFDVGLGKRRILLAVGLLTVFACFTALARTEHAPLYLSGGIWAATNLCSLTPIPAAPEEE